jgi:hypothetical protein
MGRDYQGALGWNLFEVATNRHRYAISDFSARLPSTRLDVFTVDPVVEVITITIDDFLAREALPLARKSLAQSRIGNDGKSNLVGQCLRSGTRTIEIAADDQVWVEGGQVASRALGLQHAHLVEGNVYLTLESSRGIPLRAAMSP